MMPESNTATELSPSEKARMDVIRKKFQPLFKRARKEGLWFVLPRYDTWLPPEQLAEKHDNNEMLLDPVNWELRDPQERLDRLQSKADAFREFMKAWGYKPASAAKK